jgi:serine/threonine protein kinase
LVALSVLFSGIILSRWKREKSQGRHLQVVNRAKILLKNRNAEAAIKLLEGFSSEHPHQDLPEELSLLLLRALYEARRDDQGDQLFQSLDLTGMDIKKCYEIGRLLEKSCRRELAQQVYKEVLREDEDYADVKIRMERLRGNSSSSGAGMMGLAYDPNSISSHLSNRYMNMQLIGKGGMGFVFKAFDQKRRRTVAIKALLPFLAEEEEAMHRFMREAKILAQFEHPNVVKIFDVEDHPLVFYSMEFLEGRTLGHRLEEEGPLSIRELLDLAESLLLGLAHIHKHGVVHRDIKPENVLLDSDGTPRFTDFGLAVGDQATRITQAGQVMGTLRYMAPEQLRGEEVGYQSDLFSLGVTLYEAATGIHAFSGEDRISRRLTGKLDEVTDRKFPPGLVALIEMMMEPNPEDRVQEASEALEMVRSLRKTALRKGPVTFLSETRVLRNRVIGPLSGFFGGLAAEDPEARREFFQESSNLRDLKLLIWRLNESIGRIQGAGKPPPEADPRTWARETAKLRTDLARFVRHLELDFIETHSQSLRRLEWQIDAFLSPFLLRLQEEVFEKLEEEFSGKILIRLLTADLPVYGVPTVVAVREELLSCLRELIEAGLPALQEISIRLKEAAEGDRWSILLSGEGVEQGQETVGPHFERMGGEVAFPDLGMFKVSFPFILEDPISRSQALRSPRARPGPASAAGSSSSGSTSVSDSGASEPSGALVRSTFGFAIGSDEESG